MDTPAPALHRRYLCMLMTLHLGLMEALRTVDSAPLSLAGLLGQPWPTRWVGERLGLLLVLSEEPS